MASEMGAGQSVREATFEVMRRHRMTRIFGNPGSTEIPFLTELPADFEFLLGLHEGSVVGMATGQALATGEPAFVNLHTAAGLGNAVNAIAGARDNRVPLVVVVGQQDRRQLALSPFLAGRSLETMAGDYPVWSCFPATAQDLPGAIARAWHEARQGRGPALVVAPMGDWEEPADVAGAAGAPAATLEREGVADSAVQQMADLIEAAERPAMVVGAGSDTPDGWAGGVALAEKLRAPVYSQEFASRAGFPQYHPLFAGVLHWSRGRLREAFANHDLVLAIGTSAFMLYIYDPGAVAPPTTRVAVITDLAEEANRSTCELALIGAPGAACAAIAGLLAQRPGPDPEPFRPPADLPAAAGGGLAPGHVFTALRERLPADAIVVEEAPSSRPELMRRIPARAPMGFLSAANGCLGFGLAASIGLALAQRRRPVVAVLGDGSTLYAVQALWSAVQYEAPVLAIVLANGRYAVMDELARRAGGSSPWPGFEAVDLATVAAGFGCPARRVSDATQLDASLDEVIPGLTGRGQPLLLEVAVRS